MRKQDPKYITNLAREVIIHWCKQEMKRANKNFRDDPKLRKVTSPMDEGDVLFVVLGSKAQRQLRLDNARKWFEESLNHQLQSMTNEKLGKVIGYGLGYGDEDGDSFRKTPYEILQSPGTLYPNGRNSLLNVAAAVLSAAIWDYLEVIGRARDQEMGYSDAGLEYLEDCSTASRSFSNSFVRTVVGTGP